MVRQEIYGFLLAHNAVSSLICTAATETGLDPHRVRVRRHRPDRPRAHRRSGRFFPLMANAGSVPRLLRRSRRPVTVIPSATGAIRVW